MNLLNKTISKILKRKVLIVFTYATQYYLYINKFNLSNDSILINDGKRYDKMLQILLILLTSLIDIDSISRAMLTIFLFVDPICKSIDGRMDLSTKWR